MLGGLDYHSLYTMVKRAVGALGLRKVSVLQYIPAHLHAAIADGSGVTDLSAYIQAAINAIVAVTQEARPTLYFPGGRYRVAAQLNVTARMAISGEGGGSWIEPSIADGSVVFNYSAGIAYPEIFDLKIASSIDTAQFLTGAVNGQNCTGIKFNALVPRYKFRNVHIVGLKVGADISGHIGRAELYIEYCETGLIGSGMNSVALQLHCENNRKDFAITNSNGLKFEQLLIEGNNSATTTSTLDNCHGVRIDTPYFEWGATGRDTPYITIGATTECTNVEIGPGHVVGPMDFSVYPIALDRVDGVSVNAYLSMADRNVSVSTTANTKNYSANATQSAKTLGVHDVSNQLGPCFNYFPNRNFDMWFRGWGAVGKARCATAQETAIVRKGTNALRITPTVAQTNNNVVWQLSGPAATYLRNKTIRAYAWIWVPDILAYDESVASGARQLPALYIGDFDGANAQTSAARNTGYKKGAWNFMESDVITVQNDATRIDLTIYTNNNGAVNAAGGEFVVVDSVYIVEASTPYRRVLNDDVLDSPYIDAIGVAGRMIYYADAAPADANQVYAQGDRVHKLTPAAAASPGWVCTTAGAGGVAVFKAEAAVAA